MRVKRAKAYKKAMQFYQQAFDFRQPYQVLITPDFIDECITSKLSMKDDLPDVFQGPVKQLVSECALKELRKGGDEKIVALAAIKLFERRRCPHKELSLTGLECVRKIMGKVNEHNYAVATQDPKLRRKLRDIPGVPIVHVKQRQLVLEPITQVSRDELQRRTEEKLRPSRFETKAVKSVKRLDRMERIQEIKLKKLPPSALAKEALARKKAEEAKKMKKEEWRNRTKAKKDAEANDAKTSGNVKGSKAKAGATKKTTVVLKAKENGAKQTAGSKRTRADEKETGIVGAVSVASAAAGGNEQPKRKRKRIRTHKKKADATD